MAEKKFEAALARLEELVAELEKGDLPLEQSLKFFEEGIKLSRICNRRLERWKSFSRTRAATLRRSRLRKKRNRRKGEISNRQIPESLELDM
jgi:exodeoxyribonuclease VII small subunit